MKPTYKHDHRRKTIRAALDIPVSEEEYKDKIANILVEENNYGMRSEMLAEIIKVSTSVEEAVAITWSVAGQKVKLELEKMIEDIG